MPFSRIKECLEMIESESKCRRNNILAAEPVPERGLAYSSLYRDI
jgi:hypothetical protein